MLQQVRVSAYPQDLPHDVKVDVSSIKTVNDVIFVKDLDLGKKVEVLEDLEAPVVTVVALQQEEAEESASEGEETSEESTSGEEE